jgi:hypothetical protein
VSDFIFHLIFGLLIIVSWVVYKYRINKELSGRHNFKQPFVTRGCASHAILTSSLLLLIPAGQVIALWHWGHRWSAVLLALGVVAIFLVILRGIRRTEKILYIDDSSVTLTLDKKVVGKIRFTDIFSIRMQQDLVIQLRGDGESYWVTPARTSQEFEKYINDKSVAVFAAGEYVCTPDLIEMHIAQRSGLRAATKILGKSLRKPEN